MKNTNEIMLHALGTLWPKDEPKPSLEAFNPYEWVCTTGSDPCGYAATQEEALYRYALICQKYDDKFAPVIEYLADFVDNPIIDEKPIGPFVEMDEVVNNFFQP
jgi:hypothetical protein